MSTRATLGLAVLFAVLLAGYVLTGRIDRSINRQATQAQAAFSFDAESIQSISIAPIGQDFVEAKRDENGEWQMVIPQPEIAANQQRWTALSATLAQLTNERTIDENPSNRADFQLDTPLLTVIVGTTNNTLTQLAFGSLDPTQVNRYAQIGDGPVFLASANAFSMLNRDLEDLRDRRAFTHLDDGITQIHFIRHATTTAEEIDKPNLSARAKSINQIYQHDDSGIWTMIQPTTAILRQDKIQQLAAQLRATQGRGYIDEPEDLSDYGLDPPFAQVTVHGDDGEPQTLQLGWLSGADENTGIFVKRADAQSVFVADPRLFLLLPAEPNDFREKRLFTREAKALQTIRYRDTRNEFVLEQDEEEGWRIVQPPAEDTDQIAVSMYVAMLKSIEAESFPQDEQDASLDSPRITLDFTYSDNSGPTQILIGAPLADSNPVTFYARQDIGVTSAISFDAFRMLQATPFDFRVKKIFPLQASEVHGIDLLFEDRRYVFRLDQDNWILDEPRGARLETQSDVRALLQTLLESRATGIAESTSHDQAIAGGMPLLRVSLALFPNPAQDQANSFGPVEIGERTDANSRQRYITVQGKSTVYLIDQSLINEIREALRGVIFAEP